eukprot:gnl/TRDRNA2_/TRDRNA2_184608_c0_seq1.p1 gnl/TRDRNA2_/TRDRNA2_184608_c0~~gnl/TRDRNA2_/TRDRNA2_184608_c0_seq1.p1  ORF type:complete len:422 (+),score=50.94 gnl/TRDRNA2_/TRDRNA2_184608_c0_seq1:82-1347(+)
MRGPSILPAPIDEEPHPIHVVEHPILCNPRRCLLALVAASCWTVIHVQQNRYLELMMQQRHSMDMGQTLPWEIEALVPKNGSFEATLVDPAVKAVVTFAHFGGLGQTLVTGQGRPVLTQTAGAPMRREDIPPEVTALAVTESSCAGHPSARCYLGAERMATNSTAFTPVVVASPTGLKAVDPAPAQGTEENWASCHRFLTGESLDGWQPLPSTNWTQLCTKSLSISALVPVSGGSRVGGDGSLVVWPPPRRRDTWTCAAMVTLQPELQIGPVIALEHSSYFFYDDASSSIVAVGFSPTMRLVLRVLDPTTLEIRRKYMLPISSGWLLRTQVSEGFALLVAADEPFAGTTFAVDLRGARVIQQDPTEASAGRGGNLRAPTQRNIPVDVSMPATVVGPSANTRVWSTAAQAAAKDLCGATLAP